MLSFINIMGKKNPLDEDDEEGSENGKKKVEISGFIGWQDALVLLVIIGAIVGGYKYYQHTKRESAELFAAARFFMTAATCLPRRPATTAPGT